MPLALRSADEAADVIAGRRSADQRIVVGIVGSPGAGKSTLAERLVGILGPRAALLPLDGFHLPQGRLVELGRRDRMGAPDTFDVDAFRATLVAIRRSFASPNSGGSGAGSGAEVTAPGFDRGIEESVPGAIRIPPESDCVVVEGNYLLLGSGGWERIGPLLDLTLFLDIDQATRLDRLAARHERYGKSVTDARAWALGPDEANAQLIEGTAARADYRITLP